MPEAERGKVSHEGSRLQSLSVALVAFSLYIPIQTTTVSSKHLAVALDLKEEYTGFYMAKLYGLRNLISIVCSISMYTLRFFMPNEDLVLTLVSCFLMLLSRLIAFILLFTSTNLALDFYNIMAFISFAIGAFQMPFFGMTADYVTLLSAMFKLSRLFVWLLQLLLDATIPSSSLLMIRSHFFITFIICILSFISWTWFCIHIIEEDTLSSKSYGWRFLRSTVNYLRKLCLGATNKVLKCPSIDEEVLKCPSTDEKVLKCPSTDEKVLKCPSTDEKVLKCPSTDEKVLKCISTDEKVLKCISTDEEVLKCPSTEKEVENLSSSSLINFEEIKDDPEPPLYRQFVNSFVPLFYLSFSTLLKCILIPGILPYSLIEREKCHVVNMLMTPCALASTLVVHFLYNKYPSIRRPWSGTMWNLLWLIIIPSFIVFCLTFVALHRTDSIISELIIGNVWSISVMAIVFYLCHPLVESAGFLGVASNVKHNGTIHENGIRMVITSQLLSIVTYLIGYKISIGYSSTRREYLMSSVKPTEDLSNFAAFFFWIKHTFINAYLDFVNEFRGNIKDYI